MTQGLCCAESEATFVASQLCLQEKQNHTLFQFLMKEVHSHNQRQDVDDGSFLAVGFPNHNASLYQFAQLGIIFKVIGTQKSVTQFLARPSLQETLNAWMMTVPLVNSSQLGQLVFSRERSNFQNQTLAMLRRQVKKDARFKAKMEAKGETVSPKVFSDMKRRQKTMEAIDVLIAKEKLQGIPALEEFSKTHIDRAQQILRNRPKWGALNQGKVLLKIGCQKVLDTKDKAVVSSYGLFSTPAIKSGNVIGFAPWKMLEKVGVQVDFDDEIYVD